MPHSQSFIVNLMEKVSVLRLLLSIILYLIAKSWVCNDTAQLLKGLESNQKLGLLLLNAKSWVCNECEIISYFDKFWVSGMVLKTEPNRSVQPGTNT